MMVCLNDIELDLLEGLPLGARWLYLLIRRRMDGATRIAGRGLSWVSLGRELGADPGPGKRGTGDLSIEEVRTCARALLDRGLIEMRSDAHLRLLIFLCPWAPQGRSVQNKLNSKSTDQLNRPLRPEKGVEVNRSTPPQLNRALGSIVLHSQSLTPEAVARANDAHPDKEERPVDELSALYPWEGFKEAERRLLYGMVSKTKLDLKTAQAVLDELAGQVLEATRSGKPIKNLNGYAAKTFRNAERDPAWRMSRHGHAIRERRELVRDRERTPPAPVPVPHSAGPSAAAAANLAAMREMVGGVLGNGKHRRKH